MAAAVDAVGAVVAACREPESVCPDQRLAGKAAALEELLKALFHAERAALYAACAGTIFDALVVALGVEAAFEVEDVF